jgi:hypothetical protein
MIVPRIAGYTDPQPNIGLFRLSLIGIFVGRGDRVWAIAFRGLPADGTLAPDADRGISTRSATGGTRPLAGRAFKEEY